MDKVEEFINDLRDNGKRSAADLYQYMFPPFIEFLKTKGKTLDDFNVANVKNYISSLKVGKANATIAAIRSFSSYMIDASRDFERWTKMREALRGSYQKKKRTIVKEELAVDELKRLLDMISDDGDEDVMAGVITTFYFGWRPIEAAERLLMGKINWDGRTVRFRGAKTQDERIIPFSKTIVPYLQTWVTVIKQMRRKGIKEPRKWLTDKLKKYSIRTEYLHEKIEFIPTAKTGRKTFETEMRKRSISDWKIDWILGHTSGIQGVYSDWGALVEDLRPIMEKQHYMINGGVIKMP